jgi:prevent-host-death family protein
MAKKKKNKNIQYKYIPEIVSTSELQRGAGRVVDMVRESNRPAYIVRNNNPQAVIIGVDEYEEMKKKQRDWEMKDALEKVAEAEKDLQEGNVYELTDKVMKKWLDEAKKS